MRTVRDASGEVIGYHVLEGRVWVFVLLWVVPAPLVVHKLRS